MRAKPTDSNGQGLLEALLVLPALCAAVLTLFALMWVGWLRLEVGQLVQNLGACLSSAEPDRCQGHFRRSLTRFPGGWTVGRVLDGPDQTQVEILYRVGTNQLRWVVSEPKVFRVSR